MATVQRSLILTVPRTFAPLASIRFRLQRDGELALGRRTLRLYRSWETITQLCMVFEDEGDGFGLSTQVYRVPLAELLAQGEWVAVGVDDNPPRKTKALYLALSESGTYTFNITQNEGGGSGGSPAVLDALVKVDRVPANREVVVLEKPADGKWRVAGFGSTLAGELSVELRVTGGSVYALSLDDWGTVFTADLAVTAGQTIRPGQYSGWLYRITEPGTLPATEPQWWAAEGDNAPRLLGTARAIAVRYYQPLAHGPVPVEII